MTVHGDNSPGKASPVRGALLFTPANQVGLSFDVEPVPKRLVFPVL